MTLVYLVHGYEWFINAQIAFVSSSAVLFASIISYSNVVKRGLKAGVAITHNRDTLDKVEDPYDLYDEEVQDSDKDLELKEVVQNEREKLKKNRRSVWEVSKDVKSSFSFYRIGAYALLVMGFFYLNSNSLLEFLPYLISLSIPPLLIASLLYLESKNNY